MTPENVNAQERALEALIAASLRCPDTLPEITEEEISRYVDQHVTLSSEDEAALEKLLPETMQAIKRILHGDEQENHDCPAQPSKAERVVQFVPGQRKRGSIYYRRAAFDAYVVHALANDENLGRTKIEKITHLAEYHCGINCEREPVRDAAGPVDYNSRRKVESLASKQGWYSAVAAETRWGIRYVPGPNLARALPIAERMLGVQKRAVDALITLMQPLDTKRCEIVATLYAAWNDLLLSGKTPTDEEILHESRDGWHPSKLTIPMQRWICALEWMREKHLVPKGTGKPVPPAA